MVGNAGKNGGSGGQPPANNLREIRVAEGLSKAKLARLSEVAVDTITEAENGMRQIGEVSQSRIVNGLNKNPNKLRQYAHPDVFPNG